MSGLGNMAGLGSALPARDGGGGKKKGGGSDKKGNKKQEDSEEGEDSDVSPIGGPLLLSSRRSVWPYENALSRPNTDRRREDRAHPSFSLSHSLSWLPDARPTPLTCRSSFFLFYILSRLCCFALKLVVS
jgi:hypothetical protein